MKESIDPVERNNQYLKKKREKTDNTIALRILNTIVFLIGFFILLSGESYSVVGLLMMIVSGLFLYSIAKKEDNNKIMLDLEKLGINISKVVDFGLLKDKVIIDDQNKVFVIAKIESYAKKKYSLNKFQYSKLLDFELIENNERIIKGSAMKTAAGGLTLGIVGAIIGASSKKELEKYCKNMKLLVNLDDLDSPLIQIPIIDKKIDKSLPKYKKMRKKAEELAGVFKYIQNNKQ